MVLQFTAWKQGS